MPKIAHWCEKKLLSGLAHTARQICDAERKLGLDSVIVDSYDESDWHNADDADVHVVHLFIPNKFSYDRKPKVWVAHGTPETMFESGHHEASTGQYGHADSWAVAQYWLQHADVTVTFWPRHEAIWRSLADRHARIEGVPLGIDLDFWKPVPSMGEFAGKPSLFTAENCYTIKWPLDLFIAWPWVVENGLHDARLHAIYVPMQQHRHFFPLINRNGCGYHAHVSHRIFNQEELRNAFVSTDFYVNLVRYSDHNHIGIQAAASGAKVISYKGNPYSHYWVDFGDQRIMAQQLGAILRGEVEARQAEPVPSLMRTAERFKEIYLSLGKDTPTGIVRKPKRIRVPKPKPEIVVEAVQ